jgi:glycosyltransferase involved in cell wall biosynthesis
VSSLAGVSIVYVNNFPGPRYGGGEVHMLHLVRGALAEGMRVTVVAMPRSGTAEAARAAGADVVEDELTSGAPFGAASRLTRYLRSAGARIVHGTGFYTNVISRLAGRRVHALVVDGVHCEPAPPAPFTSGPRAQAAYLARILTEAASRGRADVVIADSEALAQSLVARGTSKATITVVHNGVDPAALAAEAEKGARPALSGGPFVGTLGRLEAVKGLNVLLDAVSILAPREPSARFLVAGDGPDHAALEARIAAAPLLADRVTLLGFAPSGPAFLASLDVYCLSSLSEGFNTTILEAMALGVPVVATDAGGTREAIQDRATGRLVPTADPRALADALVETFDDADGRSRMAEAARGLVEREFTVAEMVRRTLDVYRRLLNGA